MNDSRAAQYVSHMVRWDKWNIVNLGELGGVHRLIILETSSGDEIDTLVIPNGEKYLNIPENWDYVEAEIKAGKEPVKE